MKVTYEEYQRIVLAATRYACGRASYVPSVVCALIEHNMGALEPKTKGSVIAIIEDHLMRGNLGWDFDRNYWLKVAEKLSEDLAHPSAGTKPAFRDTDTAWLVLGSALRWDKATDTPELSADAYLSIIERNIEALNPK